MSLKNYLTIQDADEISSMFQVLFSFIRQLEDIPEHDQNLCRQFFKPVFVKKGTLLETEGTIHVHHNFIVSGYMRNFHHNQNGKEITTDLNDGPRFFTSYHGFMKQAISNENLECLSDCQLLRINYKDNVTITRLGKNSRKFVEKILQHYLESSKQRIIDINEMNAKERYLKLLTNQPSLIQNVSINHIASYLGINPGSLSRIRQEIIE